MDKLATSSNVVVPVPAIYLKLLTVTLTTISNCRAIFNPVTQAPLVTPSLIATRVVSCRSAFRLRGHLFSTTCRKPA